MLIGADTEYLYTVAGNSELNELLEGCEAGLTTKWERSRVKPVTAGLTGVIWKKMNEMRPLVRPLVLIARQDDQRYLFGRYASLRSHLSPLTSWCHFLEPGQLEHLDSLKKFPKLGGLATAWTGLIVAEARLRADRPVSQIRISACLATHSFAVARASALWSHVTPLAVAERLDTARNLFRPFDQNNLRAARLQTSLSPIWSALQALGGMSGYTPSEIEPIVSALRTLRDARERHDPAEAARFAAPLMKDVPRLADFAQLADLRAEARLQLFDVLVDQLQEANRDKTQMSKRVVLPLAAGYLATIAAGGKPSLSIAERTAARWPAITAWAYTIGGLGEQVSWTSSFDGLGRLVARELDRPLHFEEPPTCDFALEEAMFLVDRKLNDPFVHLRIKQARVLTVALLPGVNILVGLSDLAAPELAGSREHLPFQRQQSVSHSGHPESRPDLAAALAEAIWPHIRSKVERLSLTKASARQSSQKQPRKSKKKRTSQEELPIDKQ